MANKNDNYFFISGDEIESQAIIFPYKGAYYKNVRDISDMDLATIDLGTNLKDELKDCNPNVNFDGHLYVGKYPYAHGIKMFKPIEITKSTNRINTIVDRFRDIAYHRNFLYYSNRKLDFDDKSKLVQLAYEMIQDMTQREKDIVFSSKSIVGYNIKHGRLHDKHQFETQIANYTQLRNLLINYLRVKGDKKYASNYLLREMAKHIDNIRSLHTENSETVTEAVKLYREALLRAKDEEEMKKAAERLTTDTTIEYKQMNIFDYVDDPFNQLVKK